MSTLVRPQASAPSSLGNRQSLLDDTASASFFAEAGELVTAIVTPENPMATLSAEFDDLGGVSIATASGEAVIIPLVPVVETGTISLEINSDLATSVSFDIYRNVNIEDLASSLHSTTDISDSYLPLGSGRFAAIGATDELNNDEFSFPVTSGASLNIVIDGISASMSTAVVELFDPSDLLVATASTQAVGTNVGVPEMSIRDFVAASDGDYTVRVSVSQATIYSTLVLQDFVYDFEPNNLVGFAIPLDGENGGALGSLALQPIGHTHYSDPTAFVDISSTGTALDLSDETERSVTTTVGNALLPAGTITIANNGGVIAQANADAGRFNTALPVPAWNQALLPFWDDLDDSQGNVFWEELQIDGINALIVQWHQRPHYYETGAATFQLQLFETGPVAARFAYQDVIFGDGNDNGGGATIGVQRSPSAAANLSLDTANILDGDVIDITLQEVDAYSFSLNDDEQAVFNTSTPFDDPANEPANELDPFLTILDADGNILATDLNSATDGRNASLTFAPGMNATYYVAIGSETGEGEYVLSYDALTIVDGDFNADGLYDCVDIDALTVAVSNQENPVAYDLTGDGVVDLADRDAWLAEAGMANGFASPLIVGDVNLDGTNDGQDFVIWNAHKFMSAASYCLGDIDMNGSIDGTDFVAWNATKFNSSGVAELTSSVAAIDVAMQQWEKAPRDLTARVAEVAGKKTKGLDPHAPLRAIQVQSLGADSARREQPVEGKDIPIALNRLHSIDFGASACRTYV